MNPRHTASVLIILVSEDFDMSLRLQMNKFIVRLATYHNGGFKEGVSLTVYDELARWEKYVFNSQYFPIF
jgi:hypothetical protein